MTAGNMTLPMPVLTFVLNGASVRPSLHSTSTALQAWRRTLTFTSWAAGQLSDLNARVEQLPGERMPQGGLAQPSMYAFS